MRLLALILAVAEEADEAPSDPTAGLGIGAIALILAVSGVLVWAGYLVLNARRRRKAEETPANLQPYLSDDELENNRLTRVLGWSVIVAAVLAISLPVYYINESKRQANAAEKFEEFDVEEGEHWYEFFECISCHGPEGVGGGAEFIEARSGLDVTWTAPSLNDVFYRFDTDEVEHVEVFGRNGTPMPGNGLEGGGAMTFQEIEQVISYLQSIQISQGEALDEVDGVVESALNRLSNAEATIETLIAEKQAEIEDIQAAVTKFSLIEDFPLEIQLLLSADGTCTEASANLVGTTCGRAGADTDRDGITTQAEVELEDFIKGAQRVLTVRQAGTLAIVRDPAYDIEFKSDDAFTNEDAEGNPIADLDELDAFLTALDASWLTLSVTAERNDVFLEQARAGLAFLENALAERLWEVDLDEIASSSGMSIAETERALGLFNAYCARCHTAGYQAGVAFQRETGGGAWGPSLLDARSVIQFPDEADQMRFIISGSEFGVNYGINGLGSGRMPGFGQILSTEDIELIIKLERAL